jgi:hypothetical protein
MPGSPAARARPRRGSTACGDGDERCTALLAHIWDLSPAVTAAVPLQGAMIPGGVRALPFRARGGPHRRAARLLPLWALLAKRGAPSQLAVGRRPPSISRREECCV